MARDLKELKELNRELGINNDYLEGKKDYSEMTPLEQVDYDGIFKSEVAFND